MHLKEIAKCVSPIQFCAKPPFNNNSKRNGGRTRLNHEKRDNVHLVRHSNDDIR